MYQVLLRYALMVPSVHLTVFFPSFPSRLQLGSLLEPNILNMPLLIASKYKYPRSAMGEALRPAFPAPLQP
jgi:hypothetical protein